MGPAAVAGRLGPVGGRVLLLNFTCSFFGQVFLHTCLFGTVFSKLHGLRKSMKSFLLEAFIQGLVYSLVRFLQVRVLCRYFYKVESHQVVCTRDYIQ